MNTTYQLQHLSFLATDGIQLPALWFTPNDAPVTTAFLFLHGCGSASVFYKSHKLALFAQAATQQKAGFFAFNNRGAHYIKKLNRVQADGTSEQVKIGTALERIEECVADIDGAITFLQQQGIENIILIGESTGANKICVYHEQKPHNPCVGYALVGGGDDTGIWHEYFGENAFALLEEARARREAGTDQELYGTSLDLILSYRALEDLLDPDGAYNCFPFAEALAQAPMSTKPLFHAFASITKPTLILYGELDPFCMTNPHKAVEILQQSHPNPALLSAKVVSGSDHGFDGTEQQEVAAIMEWYEQQFGTRKAE